MIRRSILIFLILFLGYAVFVVRRPSIYSSQNQWNDNVVKAQNFIFDGDTSAYRYIIIGSSLSARLTMDSLPHFSNLSFAGQTIYDGLNIIKESGKLPEVLYIESNVLANNRANFTDAIFSPLPYFFTKNIPSLRADKQPIPIVSKYLVEFQRVQKKKRNTVNSPSKIDHESNVSSSNNALFDQMLKNSIANYSVVPKGEELTRHVRIVKEYVDFFEKRNVKICFFEMPVNSKLGFLASPIALRYTMRAHFPQGRYYYMPLDTSCYNTTDGIHLNSSEALKFTSFFKEQSRIPNN